MARLTKPKQAPAGANGIAKPASAGDAPPPPSGHLLQDSAPVQLRELHAKVRAALETCITLCPEAAALEPLLVATSSTEILATVTKRLSQLLRESVESKKTFITSGGLMRLQAIARQYEHEAEGGGEAGAGEAEDAGERESRVVVAMMMEDVRNINASFPAEIVAYYQG